MNKPYRYLESGLDNVYLVNGFDLSDNGELFIHDVRELHRAIGMSLVEQKNVLSGKEVKFIRKHMDMSQTELGDLLSVGYQSVLNWEKEKCSIDGAADRLLKLRYFGFLNPDSREKISEIIDMITKMDKKETRSDIVLEEHNNQWAKAAA